jgi:hypothetical protein
MDGVRGGLKCVGVRQVNTESNLRIKIVPDEIKKIGNSSMFSKNKKFL